MSVCWISYAYYSVPICARHRGGINERDMLHMHIYISVYEARRGFSVFRWFAERHRVPSPPTSQPVRLSGSAVYLCQSLSPSLPPFLLFHPSVTHTARVRRSAENIRADVFVLTVDDRQDHREIRLCSCVLSFLSFSYLNVVCINRVYIYFLCGCALLGAIDETIVTHGPIDRNIEKIERNKKLIFVR